jgi:hypothetical protein
MTVIRFAPFQEFDRLTAPPRGAPPPARGANSSSVELTNTRTRWSGVRIGTSIRSPQRPDAYDRRLGQSRPSTPHMGDRGLIDVQFGNIGISGAHTA